MSHPTNSSKSKSPSTAAHFSRAQKAKPSLCRSPCPANRRASASSKTSAATRPPKSRNRRAVSRAHRSRLPPLRRLRRMQLSAHKRCNPAQLQAGHSARDTGSRAACKRLQRSKCSPASRGAIATASASPSTPRAIPATAAAARTPSFPSASAPSPRRSWSAPRSRSFKSCAKLRRTFIPLRSLSSATRTKPHCWQPFSFPTPERSASNRLRNRSPSGFPRSRALSFCSRVKRVSRPARIAQWGAPSLAYRAAGFDYRVDHGAFFQVNRWLIDALVERVTGESSGTARVGSLRRRRSLRAQAGRQFERVVAVESAPSATTALEQNLSGTRAQAVKSETLDFLRRQSEGDRPDLIVVDPPRTGLGAETTAQLARIAAPALVYVSCDPATLARDLRALTAPATPSTPSPSPTSSRRPFTSKQWFDCAAPDNLVSRIPPRSRASCKWNVLRPGHSSQLLLRPT